MFYDLFYDLCKKKGVSVTKATVEIGLSRTIGTKWKNTGATPNGETLNKIANYFDVPVDYLLGKDEPETKKPTPENEDGLDPLTVRLNELLAQATDETKLAMIALLEQFLKRPETKVSLRR